MEVFHFGAGSIGRGFIGKILSENSYNVTFIDVNEEIISQLNKDNEYTVETVGANSKTETVKNVCGLLSGDLEGIKRKVPAASARYGQDKAAGTNCKLKQRVRKAQKSFTGGV